MRLLAEIIRHYQTKTRLELWYITGDFLMIMYHTCSVCCFICFQITTKPLYWRTPYNKSWYWLLLPKTTFKWRSLVWIIGISSNPIAFKNFAIYKSGKCRSTPTNKVVSKLGHDLHSKLIGFGLKFFHQPTPDTYMRCYKSSATKSFILDAKISRRIISHYSLTMKHFVETDFKSYFLEVTTCKVLVEFREIIITIRYPTFFTTWKVKSKILDTLIELKYPK